jgi:hypothetical protein
MNSLQMSLFPLDDGTLINVFQITTVDKDDRGYTIWFGPGYGAGRRISDSEYERLKQLYCPPTQTIL